MTGPEWQAELVRLAMEAVERAETERHSFGSPVQRLTRHLNERMAQAAQAIVCEVEEARGGGDRERLDRVDATARALFVTLAQQPGAHDCDLLAVSRAYGEAAYAHAEAVENARAAWLAKRGQR